MIKKRKTKSEKRKTESEKTKKRKAKSEKQKVSRLWRNECLRMHELFDWRKTLTHFLTHLLAHAHTHSLMYSDTKQ